jgi:hypothetical protein
MKEHLKRFISEPLVIPRWMLTAKYVFFVVLGIFAAMAGIPSFDLTTWSGYTTPWSAGVVISASLAAYASLSPARERQLEKWAAVALVSFLAGYVIAAWTLTLFEWNLGRVIFSWIVAGVTMLPAVRMFDLLRQYGLRRVD